MRETNNPPEKPPNDYALGERSPSQSLEVTGYDRADSPVEGGFDSAPTQPTDNATTPQVPKSKSPTPPARPALRPEPAAAVVPNFNASGQAKVAVQPTDDAVFDSIHKKLDLLARNFTDKTRLEIDQEINMLQSMDADVGELIALKRQQAAIIAEWAKNKNPNHRPISQVLAVNQLAIESKGLAKRARTTYIKRPALPAPWENVGTGGGGPPINPEDL